MCLKILFFFFVEKYMNLSIYGEVSTYFTYLYLQYIGRFIIGYYVICYYVNVLKSFKYDVTYCLFYIYY